MSIIQKRADELIPGDLFDTRCGIGDLAYERVTRVRVVENDAPGHQDRIEVHLASNSMSTTRTLLSDSNVSVTDASGPGCP